MDPANLPTLPSNAPSTPTPQPFRWSESKPSRLPSSIDEDYEPAQEARKRSSRMLSACDQCRKKKVSCSMHQPRCERCKKSGTSLTSLDPNEYGAQYDQAMDLAAGPEEEEEEVKPFERTRLTRRFLSSGDKDGEYEPSQPVEVFKEPPLPSYSSPSPSVASSRPKRQTRSATAAKRLPPSTSSASSSSSPSAYLSVPASSDEPFSFPPEAYYTSYLDLNDPFALPSLPQPRVTRPPAPLPPIEMTAKVKSALSYHFPFVSGEEAKNEDAMKVKSEEVDLTFPFDDGQLTSAVGYSV
ncbi:hypothetical protein JCM8547_007839 [Rhodosporidiobolus lusitaniae]